MKESFDENFMADLQQDIEARIKKELEESDDDGRGEELKEQQQEREDYQRESEQLPAEGN